MQILDMEPIMHVGWWVVLLAGLTFAGIIVGVLAINDHYNTVAYGAAALSVICAVVLLFLPIRFESGKFKYVMEINENSVYHELIDRGYSITKLYDIGNIYKVTGDPLPGDLF